MDENEFKKAVLDDFMKKIAELAEHPEDVISEPTWEQVKKYCHRRCLMIVDEEYFHRLFVPLNWLEIFEKNHGQETRLQEAIEAWRRVNDFVLEYETTPFNQIVEDKRKHFISISTDDIDRAMKDGKTEELMREAYEKAARYIVAHGGVPGGEKWLI